MLKRSKNMNYSKAYKQNTLLKNLAFLTRRYPSSTLAVIINCSPSIITCATKPLLSISKSITRSCLRAYIKHLQGLFKNEYQTLNRMYKKVVSDQHVTWIVVYLMRARDLTCTKIVTVSLVLFKNKQVGTIGRRLNACACSLRWHTFIYSFIHWKHIIVQMEKWYWTKRGI